MLRFAKFQATGNDFVVVDCREAEVRLSEEQVRRICDRHRGVGADGVLSVWPHPAGVRMQVQNSDGSDAGMCGNGIRCVAELVYRTSGSAVDAVAVGTRTYGCERLRDGWHRVTMGAPLDAHPMKLELATGATLHGTFVDMGNPHWVHFVEEPPMDAALALGSELECHSAFPDRANISFVRKTARGVSGVVHERGVGITQACGSGACAIGVAALRHGLTSAGAPLSVTLPGGELIIEIDDAGSVFMEGAAKFVFASEVDSEAIDGPPGEGTP